MTKCKLVSSSALALVLSASMAAAITPEEVWQQWKDTAAPMGQTITAQSEARDGDVLKISGATFTSVNPNGTASVTFDEVLLTDVGGGSVEITASEKGVLTTTGTGTEAGKADVVMDVALPGAKVTVSGSVEAAEYVYDMPSMGFTLVSVSGTPVADMASSGSVTLSGVSGKSSVTGGDTTTSVAEIAVDAVAVAFDVADPATKETIKANLNMAGISSTSNSITPKGVDPNDATAALKAGMVVGGEVKFGQTDFHFETVDGTGQNMAEGSMAGGTFKLNMDAAKFAYGTSFQTVALNMSGSGVPMPVNMTLGEAVIDLLVPLAKSDAPADFTFVTKLIDLGASDELWALADATNAFPHDPLTLVIDTKGTATLNTDLTTEEAFESSVPPGALNSFDITEVKLSALGAIVAANGALTFDNSDMTTFAGMPKPTGKVTVTMAGVNTLLDKLSTLGFVPEDQLMGGRMMMGMFAKPIEGEEDSLISEIEFKDGGLFANGMQLQ